MPIQWNVLPAEPIATSKKTNKTKNKTCTIFSGASTIDPFWFFSLMSYNHLFIFISSGHHTWVSTNLGPHLNDMLVRTSPLCFPNNDLYRHQSYVLLSPFYFSVFIVFVIVLFKKYKFLSQVLLCYNINALAIFCS